MKVQTGNLFFKFVDDDLTINVVTQVYLLLFSIVVNFPSVASAACRWAFDILKPTETRRVYFTVMLLNIQHTVQHTSGISKSYILE